MVGDPKDLQSSLHAYVYAPDNGGEGSHYEFRPHVAYIEPGTTVKWTHAGNKSVLHSVTAFAKKNMDPQLIPRDAKGWNSGPYSGKKDPFEHTFETKGVYLYYCMPHKAFGMSGAMVVGNVGPGDPGWSPAMTADLTKKPYSELEPKLKDAIKNLRKVVRQDGSTKGVELDVSAGLRSTGPIGGGERA
ncbi:MAG: plastocyanin/azurin family copper-binding protein [Salinigranum sp.]